MSLENVFLILPLQTLSTLCSNVFLNIIVYTSILTHVIVYGLYYTSTLNSKSPLGQKQCWTHLDGTDISNSRLCIVLCE